ncbi:MAG TPA: hypothetical protein EYG11_06155 [Candidatus Latescibacteria bacterium]|nr:hypothetical protein [Candidatus Handelsmanbacteria bacterium]HIL08267.1 hypothetical protein [Candidatus Latescibacterota bacterium]
MRVIRRFSLPVLRSYLLCSLVFTLPLVLRLTTHVPGEVEGDVPVYIWNLWWMQHALSTGISPLFSDYIFAPYGASLAFHALVFLKAFIAILLQWFCSAWTAYNLLILATFTLAGYGMFLLARRLTDDSRAAWVAGLVYAFSPYMLTRGLGHLNYLSGEWIPLYARCLIRLLETRQRHWAVGGGLCLLLTAYCEYYYLIYLTMFTAYVVLALAATCALRLWGDEAVRPWLLLTLAFFLLSLGPLLHIGGDFVFGAGPVRFAVPLPYVVVRYLPLIKGARVAARFDIMVVLGLAALSAYGVRYWLGRVERPGRWTAQLSY